jgi:N,N-dimethylformamidase
MPDPTILAYADRRSLRGGERLAFKVSCRGAERYAARIVRLTSPQVFPGADHPEFRPEPMNAAIDGTYPARAQPIAAGSCGIVGAERGFPATDSFTFCAFILPTLPGDGAQCILGTRSEAAGSGMALMLDTQGRASLWLGRGRAEPALIPAAGPRLRPQRWYFVAASLDAASGRVVVATIPVAGHHFDADGPVIMSDRVTESAVAGDAPLVIAAAWTGTPDPGPRRTCLHFNGRIERPALLAVALDVEDLEELAAAGATRPPHPQALGDWDFSLAIDSQRIIDRSPHRRDGELVNLPTRAVTGSAWSGTRQDWRAVPGEYGAIHFHDDDLDDARWDTDFVLDVPADWRSGCYAAHLVAGDAEFWVPFFVRPALGEAGRRARTVFLVPTCTYAAYANFRARVTGRWNELYHGRLTVLDRTDWLMQDFPDLASSTYDVHRDGSPVVHATMLQPVTNFRPTGRIYKFCQDLLIVDWLEKTGITYEVVTDDDLHAEGAAALAPYACVVSGSHPEYYTTAMLDGLEGFLRAGGRLMYLGGNGFYWRTAFHPTLPGVVEVRRKGQGFLGPTSVPEGQFSFTGEAAGTWLAAGRPPNLICGVGFVTQGFDACEGYRRMPGSRHPRAAFVFEGVTEEVIGDYGMLQGGAAGYEIDRADAALGTPAHALVLASSDNHSNIYEVSASSFLDLLPKQHEGDRDPLRADMVFFETPGGGAVFSVGSIAWCGSLAHRGYRNDVARITGNVLRRFVDPEPFVLPRPGIAST